MSKYLEELGTGDSFSIENDIYILTSDFKNNGDRMAINIRTGLIRWLKEAQIVEIIDLYLTSDGNFTPLKIREKNDTY